MLKKKRKWLSWALVTTGVIVTLVLILALNSDPLVRWFRVDLLGPAKDDTRPTTWDDALGTVLISVFILALLVSHVGLLIAAAKVLSKPRTHAIREQATCLRCERSVQRDW